MMQKVIKPYKKVAIILFYSILILIKFLQFDTTIWSAPTDENEWSDHHSCANQLTISQVFATHLHHVYVKCNV